MRLKFPDLQNDDNQAKKLQAVEFFENEERYQGDDSIWEFSL